MSVRDLNPLSPGTSGDGNNSGGEGVRSRSATISQIKGGNPAASSAAAAAAAAATNYGTTERMPTATVPKNLNALFGVSPSDIDKYSRVVFPVCFICFNMMYWVIYLHISKVLDNNFIEEEL